jgi:hypothetical protein
VLRHWGDHVRRHPVLGVLEVTLLWHAVLIGVAEGLPPIAPDWYPDLGATLVNLVCAAVVLVLLYAWRLDTDATGRGRRWHLVLPLLAIAVSYGLAGIAGTTAQLVGSAVSLALVGINEELYSRGLSLEIARPLGGRTAAALVAVTFGVGHLQNYLLFGGALDDTLFQVLAATCYGFCLAGARLRMNTVWPLAFVHGLDDWMQINSPGKAPDWWQITVLVVFVAYGWWLTKAPKGAQRAGPPGSQ